MLWELDGANLGYVTALIKEAIRMVNLLGVPLNDLFPALQVLATHGVSREDIDDIRVYPEFAKELAQLIVQRREKIKMAVGRDEPLAKRAIEDLSDPKLLVWIAEWARLDGAAEAAMRKLAPSQLVEIARKHYSWDRVKVAAKLLTVRDLKGIIDDPSVNIDRRKDLAGELAAGYY